jgi:hypothetical protein
MILSPEQQAAVASYKGGLCWQEVTRIARNCQKKAGISQKHPEFVRKSDTGTRNGKNRPKRGEGTGTTEWSLESRRGTAGQGVARAEVCGRPSP